jgi:hypothetical protein
MATALDSMDDMEMAFLVSLYIVILHAIGECQPLSAADDHKVQDSTFGVNALS